MSLYYAGIDTKLKSTTVVIEVSEDNPLIKLANALDWREITEIVKDDLKNTTTKLLWWLGRRLKLRIHLGVFLLQTFTKMTDRAIESAIKGNGIYQVFCGNSIVDNWHCPDHTKIEKFRNRIKPETQQKIVSYIVQVAQQHGFADPTKMDIDSTVQEAYMTYPSDARLLVKLVKISKKIMDYMQLQGNKLSDLTKDIHINIKAVKEKAKAYFFMAKNTAIEIKRKAFKVLYNTVKKQVTPVIQLLCFDFTEKIINRLPWNIKRSVEQIKEHAKKYLQDVKYFIKTNTMKPGKILSFHLNQVACIIKGKVGKEKEFGRVFQLGRTGGNFFIVLPSTSVRQEDKESLIPFVKEHENIFGENSLFSITTDKKYYTKENIKFLQQKEIEEIGVQFPYNIKDQYYISEELKNRRAGIEPLIGHVKNFGLRKSKMKSDETTLAYGYRAILGFDLHQFMRYLA